MESNEKHILVVSLSDYQIPVFKENKSTGFITYGKDNKYPEYLLDLYNTSPKHGAIIRSKANYVAGKGFTGEGFLKKVNKFGETANNLLVKQALDFEIHSGFYIQVIWAKDKKKIAELYHLDYHKVRSNKDNTEFYYKNDWSKPDNDDDPKKTFQAFDPENRKGSQILYCKSYRPGIDTYTLPDYISGLNFIEADKLVSEHVLNNAKTGFTPSKMIVFTEGEPATPEQKRDIEKRIKDKYTGAKGSKLIITFSKTKDTVPQVLDLGASDLTKEDFQQVDNLIQQNIFSCHQIVSPALFGIKTEGQLGQTNELRIGYEIFKNTYANARQQQIESVWGVLLEINGEQAPKIIPVEPVGYTLEEIKEFVPKGFIYEKIGVNPKDYPDEQPAAKEETPETTAMQFSDDDLISALSEVGEPRENFLIVKSRRAFFFSELDLLRTELEMEEEKTKSLTEAETKVIALIQKDKRVTPDVIAKALNLNVALIERIISDLQEKGVLKAKTEKRGLDKQTVWELPEMAKVEKKELDREVYIRYSYDGPKDDKNRDFCAKMLELNRVYSRAEIERISQKLGYSVWERRGGFYTNPKTNETTPYCRHHWSANTVIKKK